MGLKNWIKKAFSSKEKRTQEVIDDWTFRENAEAKLERYAEHIMQKLEGNFSVKEIQKMLKDENGLLKRIVHNAKSLDDLNEKIADIVTDTRETKKDLSKALEEVSKKDSKGKSKKTREEKAQEKRDKELIEKTIEEINKSKSEKSESKQQA